MTTNDLAIDELLQVAVEALRHYRSRVHTPLDDSLPRDQRDTYYMVRTAVSIDAMNAADTVLKQARQMGLLPHADRFQ